MPPNDEGSSQLQNQLQINEILKGRSKIYSEHESHLSKQLKLTLGIKEAAEGGQAGMDKAAKRLEEIANSEKAAADAADKAAAAQKNFSAEIKRASDESEELQKKLEKASEVAGIFGDALSNATTSTLGMLSPIGSLAGSIFNVGKSILAIPFALWDAFTQASSDAGGGSTALAQAMEDVRKSFGKLEAGSGAKVVEMYRNLSKSGAEAAKVGLGLSRVFGYGVDGQAAMLKFTAEMAGALGSQMNEVMSAIGKDMLKITYGIKALGLSNEEAGKAMLFFKNSGQDTNKMMQEMNAVAGQLAKSTGFNIKTLGKAMVETIEVFPQFSKGGVQAMAKVADYTHRLGISVKDLQGVFDKFDSFEGAAESASQLSQAFGVQVDAMKMIKEQDPTKRFEMLRQSFKAAGKDMNQLSQAERKLVEQTTGLSGAALEAALGEGNKKKQLTESEKAAAAATKSAKDQAAAMKELAKSIERIVTSGGGLSSFTGSLIDGFIAGAKQSENFRSIMRTLQHAFREVYNFGKSLGKMFVDLFPGFTKMAQGFKKLFDPNMFKKFRIEALKIFGDFFKDIQNDPKAGFSRLWDRLKELFNRIFGSQTGGGLSMIAEGFEKFTSVAGKLLGELMKKLLMMLVDGLKNIADFIKNPGKAADAVGAATGFAANFFGPIIEALKELGPAVADAFMALLEVVFEKLKPYLEKVAIGLAMFWAAKFALNMVVGLGAMIIKEKIQKAIAGPGQDAMVDAIKENTKAMKEAQGTAGGAMQGPAASAEESKNFFKKIADIKTKDIIEAAAKITLMGVLLLVAIGVFAAGILALGAIMPMEKLAADSLSLIPVALALAAFAGALWVLSKVDISVGKLIMAALLIGVLGYVMVKLSKFSMEMLTTLTKIPPPDAVIVFGGIMAVLIPTIATMALLAVGLSYLIKPPMIPFLLAAVALIGIIGLVMIALADLAVGGLAAITAVLTDNTAKRMVDVSIAFKTFAEGMSAMASALLKFSLAIVNPLALFFGIKMMKDVADAMSEKLPEIVKKMLEATSGVSADEVKSKMEVLANTVKALEPMIGIATTLAKVAEEGLDEDFNASEIERVFTSMRTTFETIITQVSGLVTTLVNQAKSLSNEDINKANAVGSILGSTATLLGTLMKPLSEIIEVSRDRGAFSGDAEELDTKQFTANMSAMTQSLKDMVPAISAFFESNGPIQKLIDSIGKLEGFDVEQAKKIKPFSDTMKTMIDAVKFFLESFGTMVDEKNAKTGEKTGRGIVAITGMKDLLNTVTTQLFDPTTGFIPVVLDRLSKVDVPDSMVKNIEGVGKVLSAVMSPLMELIKVAADLGKFITEASKEKGFFSQEATVNTATLTTMKNTMVDMIKGMVDALIPMASNMKPLINGILNAAKEIKQNPKTLAPKLDMILKAFEFLNQMGQLFSADGPLSNLSKSPAASGAAVEPSNLSKVISNMNAVVDEIFGKEGTSPADTPINKILSSIMSITKNGKFESLAKKGVANSISNVFKAMSEVFKAISEIPAIANAPTIDEKTIDNYNMIAGKLIAIAEKGDYSKRIASLATAISATVEAISTASGTLDKEKIKPITEAVAVFSNFKGGSLSVKHNIPNVQMHVEVKLDAHQLASAVVGVDITHEDKYPARIMAGPKGVRK